jgi:peroxiredoxin Q/BCP
MTSNQQFDSLKQKRTYVLYFYPKDNTAGCAAQSIEFREFHKAFTQHNCAIFGISRDPIRSHEKFKAQLQLPFDLISDVEEVACQAFDVIKLKQMYGKQVRGIERSTFIISHEGHVLKEYRAVKIPGHVETVLHFIQTL